MGCELVYKTVPEAEYISHEAVSKGSSHLLIPAQSEIRAAPSLGTAAFTTPCWAGLLHCPGGMELSKDRFA